jgi:hypothetical protein
MKNGAARAPFLFQPWDQARLLAANSQFTRFQNAYTYFGRALR